jgi:hypothetical protein
MDDSLVTKMNPPDLLVTKMNPQVRAGLTHVGTAIGGAAAAVFWLQGNMDAIRAIIDQGGVVVRDVTAFVALVAPLATGAISVWNSRPSKKIADVKAQGVLEAAVVSDPAVAAQFGPEVQTSVHDLPH